MDPEEFYYQNAKLHSCSFGGSRVEDVANGTKNIKSIQGTYEHQSPQGDMRSQWKEANKKQTWKEW